MELLPFLPKSDILLKKKKKKITVLKNPNKDNSELKERKLEGAHCLQQNSEYKKHGPGKQFMA